MEIYNNLDTTASQEFEKLLSGQFSKTKIEEGKIYSAEVTKISDKYIWAHINGLKSEPVIDINELKTMGLYQDIKLGDKLEVLLERIENKNGEVIVSATKAQKIKGWDKLVEAFEKNEPIMGKITSKCKGGVICEHIDTGSLMFMPGSQISDTPLKDISHLMNEPLKLAVIKLDKIRGNCCVSRRQIISSFKKEDKVKLLDKFEVGQKIKGVCKGFTSFGAFFSIDGEQMDTLVHLMELSYSRISHPEDVLNIGDAKDLLIIGIDKEKLQISTSIRQLSPDPFLEVDKYKINENYQIKVIKFLDFGLFGEFVDSSGLTVLLHNSELSHLKKNLTAKKLFKLGEIITVKLIDVDKDKRRIAASYKATQENPFKVFENKYKIGDVCEMTVKSSNEYALFVATEDFPELDCFLHCNDLTFNEQSEEELKKYKEGDKIQVKILQIQIDEQKVRVSHRATLSDPFDWFADKKIKEAITVKIISTDNKGLVVRPEGCEMNFVIKKSAIAINIADARPARFTGGERIDCAIQELDFDKRKVTLSIKLLEEIERKVALDTYGSEASGKNLPFSSLSEDLEKKKKEE
ncbi:S1 RNA-binding domain-containing protein [Candidatus Pelagibacter sp. Uisw_113]|uniref:S1 RNA-binding domain-containing protein n=1 Tax=Candidatus Pelagibacter sp. Uisw_113 TaxID=3230994 RepID=UPI0039EBE094